MTNTQSSKDNGKHLGTVIASFAGVGISEIARATNMPKIKMHLLILALVTAFTAASRVGQADDPPVRVLSLHKNLLTGLAFTPDGTRLVSTSLSDDRISTIVPDDGASSSIGDSVGAITGIRSHAVAISPDGTQVAIAGFKVTTMYDLKTLNQQWQIDTSDIYNNPPTVKALAFSSDGKLLATLGCLRYSGRITIRNADTGKEIHRFEGWWHHPAGYVSFADDGIAFSPDGKLFAAGSFGSAIGEGPRPGELRVWDAERGKLLSVWRTKDSVQPGKDNAAIYGIAFSPDSRRIAIACSDGDVWIWDIATKQVSGKLKGHRSTVRRVTFSPDGQYLASAGRDQTVRLWSTESWKQLASLRFDTPQINALRFSPDSNSLVAGGGRSARIAIPARSGRPARPGHPGLGEVRIWELAQLIQK